MPRPGGLSRPPVFAPVGRKSLVNSLEAGAAEVISLHSRPESAKQVVGTLGMRVTALGGIGALRPHLCGKGLTQRGPAVAGVGSIRPIAT